MADATRTPPFSYLSEAEQSFVILAGWRRLNENRLDCDCSSRCEGCAYDKEDRERVHYTTYCGAMKDLWQRSVSVGTPPQLLDVGDSYCGPCLLAKLSK